MQAKPIHSPSPYITPPLLRPPPVHQASLSSQTVTKPKPISVPIPNTDVVAPGRILQPVKPFIEPDDSIAASWDYNFLFMSQRSETTQPIRLRVVEGALPTDFPSGAYYLTGPGIFKDDHGS